MLFCLDHRKFGCSGSAAVDKDAARKLIRGLDWNEIVKRLNAVAGYAAALPAAEAEMKRLGKNFMYEIYKGAGYAFLRAQDGKDGANLKAAQQAWPRMLRFLKETLS